MVKLWYALQRRIDMTTLWPSCRDMAPDLDHAKSAFYLHAINDPAWLILGEDEIHRRIDALG